MTQKEIDHRGKIPIALKKVFDANEQPYYIGVLKFNGSLDLNAGQSFFVFISEEECEELQIGPLDPSKKKFVRPCIVQGEKWCIPLKKYTDKNKKTYYVAELVMSGVTQRAHKGLFFTVFTSREGEEELHISPLRQKHKP